MFAGGGLTVVFPVEFQGRQEHIEDSISIVVPGRSTGAPAGKRFEPRPFGDILEPQVASIAKQLHGGQSKANHNKVQPPIAIKILNGDPMHLLLAILRLPGPRHRVQSNPRPRGDIGKSIHGACGVDSRTAHQRCQQADQSSHDRLPIRFPVVDTNGSDV